MPLRINYETSWLISEACSRDHITEALRAIQQEFAVVGRLVVEFGSGIGTNLAVFAQNNSVLGVEGLTSAAEEARSRGIDTRVEDIEQPTLLPEMSADWVLCIDVLEHLMNPAACLANAHRILRDDGFLVVNVPNHFDLRGRIRILLGSGIDSQRYFATSPHWEYPHVRFFSRRSIEDLLRVSGFKLVADYGPRFVAFPRLHVFRNLGFMPALRAMQARWPDLFSAGFFLICKKRGGGASR